MKPYTLKECQARICELNLRVARLETGTHPVPACDSERVERLQKQVDHLWAALKESWAIIKILSEKKEASRE